MMRNTVRGHRRSIRLNGYDYASAGAYFVTICAQERACVFGDVVDGEMRANACGRIVQDVWDGLASRYANVDLDAFVVMPNHVHGIIVLMDVPRPGAAGARGDVCRGAIHCAQGGGAMDGGGAANHEGVINHARTTLGEMGAANSRAGAAGRPPLGEVVRAFKAVSARRIRQQILPGAAVWQRNYYEQIIRDDDSLNRVRAYVSANPTRWLTDRDNQNPIHGTERRPND
jgi:REP element-mobilizing transposase RayT